MTAQPPRLGLPRWLTSIWTQAALIVAYELWLAAQAAPRPGPEAAPTPALGA